MSTINKPELEINRLRQALAQAATDLKDISRWRRGCHDYDLDIGRTKRVFSDDEAWSLMEKAAGQAAKKAALAAGQNPGCADQRLAPVPTSTQPLLRRGKVWRAWIKRKREPKGLVNVMWNDGDTGLNQCARSINWRNVVAWAPCSATTTKPL